MEPRTAGAAIFTRGALGAGTTADAAGAAPPGVTAALGPTVGAAAAGPPSGGVAVLFSADCCDCAVGCGGCGKKRRATNW